MLLTTAASRPDGNVLRVVAARFISHTGGTAGFFLGIWGKAAYDLDADAFGLALVMAVNGLGGILGSIVAGLLVDRYDPRKVLVGSELVFVPAVLGLILADSIASMMVLLVPTTIAGASVFTAVAALPPYLTTDDRTLERINAWVEGAGTAAFITGPVVGAVLVKVWSVGAVFVFDAATSLIGVGILLGVRLRVVHKDRDKTSMQELREGFTFTYGSRALRVLLLLATSVYLSFGIFGALEPLFFRDVLHRGPEVIGYVNAVFGIGLLAGAVTYARTSERLTTFRGAATLAIVSGGGAVLYTFSDQLPIVLVGAVFWGAVLGALMPLLRTLAQLEAPEGMVGRVMGTLQVHHQAGDLVPLAFAPALAAAFGPQAVLVGAGVVVASFAAAMLPTARTVPTRRRVSVGTGEALERLDEPIAPPA